jgi:hypothetical protein
MARRTGPRTIVSALALAIAYQGMFSSAPAATGRPVSDAVALEDAVAGVDTVAIADSLAVADSVAAAVKSMFAGAGIDSLAPAVPDSLASEFERRYDRYLAGAATWRRAGADPVAMIESRELVIEAEILAAIGDRAALALLDQAIALIMGALIPEPDRADQGGGGRGDRR